MNKNGHLSQYISEGIGTFFMVLFGCGAIIQAELNPYNLSGFIISLSFGVVVAIMIYSTGHISGAHFNPAVTLAFYANKKFPANKLLGYISFQLLGAILASMIHYFLFGSHHSFGTTSSHLPMLGLVLTEFLISFLLMFVITAVATDSRAVGELAGLAIGATVFLAALIAGPLTGASMNPARSIAPSLFSGNFANLGFYILIPVLGTIAGALTYEKIKCIDKDPSKDHGCC